VELENLGRRYGLVYVLKDINLVISEGKTVLLRGSNGAGKTTLLKVLATRLRPSRGSVKVFGFDVVKEADEVRGRVAYLSASGGAYGALTVLENLEFAAALYQQQVGRTQLLESLEQVGLAEAKDKLVRACSSGMKKRLGLARLLLADAKLWLLDEPYAALDENGQVLLDQLLYQAKREGRSVLLASHDVERDPELIDGVLRLERGRLFAAQLAPQVKMAVADV
jgi:heme ABC exporter ATP-binding subunit CcmA